MCIRDRDNGEQALEIAEQLIRSSAIDIIVGDSVAALTPKAEIEGDMGDNKVGPVSYTHLNRTGGVRDSLTLGRITDFTFATINKCYY